MKRNVVATGDGSSTIYLPEMDEHYHSSHGAIQEAVHVFIQNGLQFIDKDEVVIFELGLGTGLNALLTIQEALQSKRKVNYIGLEAYPVDESDVAQLNYVSKIDESLDEAFSELHLAPWNVPFPINDCFAITKVDQKIQDYSVKIESVDLIYFDAFGFRAQEEMWSIDVLRKMYEMLIPNGVLVTYAARGQFKRDLKSLGFEVESLPGPPGKREMLRAIKH